MNSNHEEPKLISLKVLILGDAAVGKTCLFHRFSNGTFTQDYKATIGVDFATKKFKWAENVEVQINFWDMAGQERFYEACKSHFRETDGIFCVLDMSRTETVEKCHKWKDRGLNLSTDFRGTQNKPPIFCLGNKADMFDPEKFIFRVPEVEGESLEEVNLDTTPREVESIFSLDNPKEIDFEKDFSAWAKSCGYDNGYMVSAKTNKRVDACLKDMIGRMIDNYMNDEEAQARDQESDSFKLTDEPPEDTKKKGWGGYLGGVSNYC